MLGRPMCHKNEGTGVASSGYFLSEQLANSGFVVHKPRRWLGIPPFRSILSVLAYDYLQPLVTVIAYRKSPNLVVVVIDPAQGFMLWVFRRLNPQIRIVSIIHDLFFLEYQDLYHRYIRLLYKIVVRHSDYLVTTTAETEHLLRNEYCLQTPISVLPWGVTALPSPLKGTPNIFAQYRDIDGITVGYIGSSAPRKRLHLFGDLLHRMVASVPHVTLLLGGPISKEWQERLLGLNSPRITVVYLGQLTEEAKVHFFGAIDMFVFPTELEGFGLPIIEAFHFSKPCLIMQSASIPQLLKTGCLVLDDNLFNMDDIVHPDPDARALLLTQNKAFANSLDWTNYISFFRAL